jgi:hypothetical protein
MAPEQRRLALSDPVVQDVLNGLDYEDLFDDYCEGCDGSGVRWPAEPSCSIPEIEYSDWVIVERCDECGRYPDDLSAAASVFAIVRWIPCTHGDWHAVGRHRRVGSQPEGRGVT